MVLVVDEVLGLGLGGDRGRAHQQPGERGADGDHHDRRPQRLGDGLGERRGARATGAGSAAWNTAPEIASSRAPAKTRSIASTPEAIPAFEAGIAAIAAVDIGA